MSRMKLYVFDVTFVCDAGAYAFPLREVVVRVAVEKLDQIENEARKTMHSLGMLPVDAWFIHTGGAKLVESVEVPIKIGFDPSVMEILESIVKGSEEPHLMSSCSDSTCAIHQRDGRYDFLETKKGAHWVQMMA